MTDTPPPVRVVIGIREDARQYKTAELRLIDGRLTLANESEWERFPVVRADD